MPTVPVVQRTQELRPLANVQQAGVNPAQMSIPESGGVAIARGTLSLAAAVQKEQDDADDARAFEAYNQLAKFATDSVYGKEGVRSKLGKDALGVGIKWSENFDASSNQIAESLNERQKKRYAVLASNLRRTMYGTVVQHEAAQGDAYRKQEMDAAHRNAIDAVTLDYANKDAVATHLTTSLIALERSPEFQGASAEAQRAMAREREGAIRGAVVAAATARGDVKFAADYFKQHSERFTPEQRLKLQPMIEKEMRVRTASEAADAVWVEMGPRTDTDATSLDAMDAKLRERFKDDPEALSIARASVRERATARDYSIKQRDEARTGGLWRAVLANAPLRQLQSMPEFRDLDGRAQATFISQVETFRKRHEGGEGAGSKQLDQYLAFYEITKDPAALAEMSENAVVARAKDMGAGLLDRALQLRRAAINREFNDVPVQGARQVFERTFLGDSGFGSMAKMPTRMKDRYGEMLSIFDQRVQAAAKALPPGKKITTEEVQRIADEMMIRGEVPSGKWYTFDQKVFAGEQLLGSNWRPVRVTGVNEIPRTVRDHISKQIAARGGAVNNSNIVDVYNNVIQSGGLESMLSSMRKGQQ